MVPFMKLIPRMEDVKKKSMNKSYYSPTIVNLNWLYVNRYIYLLERWRRGTKETNSGLTERENFLTLVMMWPLIQMSSFDWSTGGT